MFEQLVAQLRSELASAEGLSDERKAALQAHVDEIERLGTKPPTADGDDTGESDAQGGVGRLVSAVEELEASHPRLTESVNRIATALSDLGI